MALDFNSKDVIHYIIVKFIPAFLPGAKKKYYAKAVLQRDLDIHDVASKAEVYNITTPPKVIEEGFAAALQLIQYLTADGYKITTPLFIIHMRIPGEFDGNETHLPTNVYPEVRMRIAASFRKYIRERVDVEFDGIDENTGLIGRIVDGRTGLIDQVTTIDDILTINGVGLKIEGDAAHANLVGVFHVDSTGKEIPAKAIARNESRTLVIISSQFLTIGESYYLLVRTQSSVVSSSGILKTMREMKTEFMIIAQA